MFKTQELVNTKEKLVSALETIKGVEILNKDEFLGVSDSFLTDGGFTRKLEIFMSKTGVSYTIVWYHNKSNLTNDSIDIPFDTIVLNSPTYPVSNKNLVLQLVDHKTTVGVFG